MWSGCSRCGKHWGRYPGGDGSRGLDVYDGATASALHTAEECASDIGSREHGRVKANLDFLDCRLVKHEPPAGAGTVYDHIRHSLPVARYIAHAFYERLDLPPIRTVTRESINTPPAQILKYQCSISSRAHACRTILRDGDC